MNQSLMPTYVQPDVAFERGEGVYLFCQDGSRVLDFAGGLAVLSLGHCHPHLVAALQDQAAVLWHTSNLFRIPTQERLADRLVKHSFADAVFFANSGTEAIEAGLKLVRKYHYTNGNPSRCRVITFAGAFHGRTLGALSAGGGTKRLAGFAPALDGFDQVPFGDLDAVRLAIGDRTAAILVEPIQGEGGVRAAPEGFLRGLRKLCDKHGILLFLDEVQTGVGRTGPLWAHQSEGITPDVMALAKGLGSGFPIGACLATADAAVGMTGGSHGSTFGGNPLAMAVGNAVLDVILGEGFLTAAKEIGDSLGDMLSSRARRFPTVFKDVRGSGLLRGLVCGPDNTDVVAALRAHGLLTAPAGDNVVRLLPPLVAQQDHIDEASVALDAVGVSLAP